MNLMSAVKALLIGSFTVGIYLLVVVLTTPALPADAAIKAALELNFVVIFGMGVGVGLQIFLSDKAKKIGCPIKKKRFLGSSGSTATTSFFSFFSLVPLGCCGWWLYLLSLMPAVFGTGLSSILIEYSRPLSYVGLAIIFGFVAASALKLRQLQIQQMS